MPLRAPLLNSIIWRMRYSAGSPEMPADSGWPPPVVRWQSAQARALVSLRPWATTSGIGAWSCGYQSGGLNPSSIWAWVYDLSLPGSLIGFTASGGFGGGFTG